MEVCVQGVPEGFVESLHMVVHGRCQISVGCYQMYLQNIKRSLSSVLAIYVNKYSFTSFCEKCVTHHNFAYFLLCIFVEIFFS